MAQPLPRVRIGVGRETDPRAAVGLGLQRACQRRSKLEKDFSCKNFMWDFMWVLPVNI